MSPRRVERVHGRVLRAWTEDAGATLAADANPGATVLTVDDVSPFNDDGEGGWVKVGDQVVAYTEVDDDTATITLATAVAELVEEDEYVAVWNDLYQEVDSVQRVHVVVDGHEDNTDHLEAVVADTIDGLPNGDRGAPAEGCVLERDGDEWELVRVKGRPRRSHGVQFWQDSHTVTAPGQQTIALTHEPINNSEHLYWNGFYQPASEWSRNGQTITVPDAGGDLLVDDELVVEYAYRIGVAARPAGVPFGSAGWSYLQTPLNDTVDRSAPGYDDSAWSVGAAPFGGKEPADPDPSWPEWPPATTWDANTALWVRRTISGAGSYTVQVGIDDDADIYWNGTLIGSASYDPVGGPYATAVIPVPAGLVTSTNVVAVRAADTLGGWAFLDIEVVST